MAHDIRIEGQQSAWRLPPELAAAIVDLAEDAIISVDENQRLVLFNLGAERIFGYSAGELFGEPLDKLLPERFAGTHRRQIREFADSPETHRRMGERAEIWGRRKSGEEFPAEASISKAVDGGRQVFTVILRDISERKAAEDALKASLREKEILLKEIHHRVKNNLQVVTSLLGLQSRRVADEKVRTMFLESQNRIQSLALLHEKLYQSRSVCDIDCQEYVHSLVTHLFHAYGVSFDRIAVRIDLGGSRMDLDRALPCGLILNELVSNCLKHAFPEGRTGEIRVQMTSPVQTEEVLLIADDGVGLRQGPDSGQAKSLGLWLVKILAEQLGARLEVKSGKGTEVRLFIPQARASS